VNTGLLMPFPEWYWNGEDNMGLTRKPCHGCGKAEGWHPTGELCNKCKSKMQIADDYIAFQEKLKKDPKIIAANVPDSWCSPSFYVKRSEARKNADSETIGKIFKELVYAVSLSSIPTYSFEVWQGKYTGQKSKYNNEKAEIKMINQGKNYNYGNYDFSKTVFLDKIVAEIIERLFAEVKKELLKRETAGFEYGKNLLMQLNDGKITLKEFNAK